MAAAAQGPARRALLIGIDTYPHLPQLEGCVNDVKMMREILQENFGFPKENVTLLSNAKATRQAILDAWDALVEATGTDDLVVIHYAGHGGQMTDLEGDEPSGLDSTLQPYDTEGWQGDNRDITDDELSLKLDALGQKTRFITLIVDACHSGTITRDALGARGRSTKPDRRPAAKLGRKPVAGIAKAAPAGPSGWLPLTEKYVVISGCRDEEIAREYTPPEGRGAVTHGALSWFIGQELRKATSGTTYRDVFERAAALVTANNATQRPQMEGKADREIFGIKEIVPTRYLKVTARDGDSITLGAGAAQGVTVGSRYAIHPQGAKDRKDTAPLAEAEVTSVGVITAEARLEGEAAAGSVAADCRAFETRHAMGEFHLTVAIADADEARAAPLRTLLEASTLVRTARAGEPAAVTVRLLPARDAVTADSPVPRAGALPAPMWAATAENGDLVMKLKPVGDEKTVCDNLETIARYRQALRLENPDPDSALRGKFTLQLLKQDASGAWVNAEPEEAGGRVVYTEGDPIGFRVSSKHDADAYVALVDFEANGAVTPLRPDRTSPAAQEKLRGGGSYKIGPMAKPVPTVTWPAGYPFIDSVDHALEAEAEETVRLFVTEQPADFSVLQQKGVRSGGARKASPLGDLLHHTFQGPPTRGIQMAPETREDWTVVSASFTVRRKRVVALGSGGKAATVGNVTVVPQGVTATVSAPLGKREREAAAGAVQEAVAAALGESGMALGETVSLSQVAPGGAGGRGAGSEGVELKLPDPGAGNGQLVMATDDLGVVSWHLPGGGVTRSFSIPAGPPVAPEPGARGGLADFGNKVLREIVFPMIDPVLGKVSEALVNAIEKRRAPYRARAFTPGTTGADAPALDGEGWQRLAAGRALLLLHGPFRRAHHTWGGLPAEWLQELHRRYEGRVFAFDHFTLSHDPKENARQLLALVPEGTTLDLDIIAHSRGGLVARVLAERQEELKAGGRQIKVGRTVFVGAPNAGTPLATPANLGTAVDLVTNVLTFVPVPGVTDALALVMGILKQAAVGAAGGLDGLTAMDPRGTFLPWLNQKAAEPPTRYFAVTAKAAPAAPGLKRMVLAKGLARVLPGDNDLLLPSASVYDKNGAAGFPIAEKLVLEGDEAVSHFKYFESTAVRNKILEWL